MFPSTIFERADIWYLLFVLISLVVFFLLVVFLPKDKEYRTKDEADHES